MGISNTQNCIYDRSGKDYFKKQQLPKGVLSFEEFCKQNNINTGMTDFDIRGTRMKQAQAKYDQYLEKNNVEAPKSIFDKQDSDSDSKGADKPSIFC